MGRPPTVGLTKRQEETLRWIREFVREQGLPPTVREIGRAFGIKSSTVFHLLKRLEKKGHLKRGRLGARSLILADEGSHVCRCEEVPVKGRIAAGQPIFAADVDDGTVTTNRDVLQGGEAYALRVEGDSMKDAGILDGDCVIIRAQDTADDGDIVVALIEDEATLKKLYREKKRVRLEPANRRMKPIYVKSGELRIQGKVIEVRRTLGR